MKLRSESAIIGARNSRLHDMSRLTTNPNHNYVFLWALQST